MYISQKNISHFSSSKTFLWKNAGKLTNLINSKYNTKIKAWTWSLAKIVFWHNECFLFAVHRQRPLFPPISCILLQGHQHAIENNQIFQKCWLKVGWKLETWFFFQIGNQWNEMSLLFALIAGCMRGGIESKLFFLYEKILVSKWNVNISWKCNAFNYNALQYSKQLFVHLP